jgi:hypothetical protein
VHRVSDDREDRDWNAMSPVARRAAARARDAVSDPDDGAAASEVDPAAATAVAASGPTKEEPVQDETTPEDSRTARELLLEFLRATDGVPVPQTELRAMLRRAKPSKSRSLADMTLRSMAKAGLAERRADGWVLTDAGRGVSLCAGALQKPAPMPSARRDRSPSRPIAQERAAVETVATPAPDSSSDRYRDVLVLRVTAPMRARLEELLADGFHGDSVEEVAERFLARALRAFNNAN